jgi:hypothetical protein
MIKYFAIFIAVIFISLTFGIFFEYIYPDIKYNNIYKQTLCKHNQTTSEIKKKSEITNCQCLEALNVPYCNNTLHDEQYGNVASQEYCGNGTYCCDENCKTCSIKIPKTYSCRCSYIGKIWTCQTCTKYNIEYSKCECQCLKSVQNTLCNLSYYDSYYISTTYNLENPKTISYINGSCVTGNQTVINNCLLSWYNTYTNSTTCWYNNENNSIILQEPIKHNFNIIAYMFTGITSICFLFSISYIIFSFYIDYKQRIRYSDI